MAILAPLFKMLEATFELLVPLVIKDLVDIGIANGDKNFIIRQCLILVLFCALGYAFAITAQYFSAKAAVGVAKDLRHDMYARIQKYTHAALDKAGISNILTRMTGDVNQIQTGVNITLRLLMRSPIVVFGAVIFAFTVDVGCAIIFAVAVPLLLVVLGGANNSAIDLSNGLSVGSACSICSTVSFHSSGSSSGISALSSAAS